MSTAATPASSSAATTYAATDRLPTRSCGIGALVFVALLVVQNLIRAGEPAFDAGPTAVTQYFADHRVAVLIPLVLFPVGMVSLLCFAAGLRSMASGHGDRFLADLGTFAVLVVAALFGVVNLTEVALAGMNPAATAVPGVVAGLWAVHAAAFGLDLAAIAIALFALSRFVVQHALAPRWFAVAGPVGACCLFIASLGAVAIVEGSPLLYVGFVGFVVWGLFLLFSGVGLLRAAAGPPYRPARFNRS